MNNPSWRCILFFDPSGPMMHYSRGLLTISDLNPQLETKWTMSRFEMLRLGWRCIIASLR